MTTPDEPLTCLGDVVSLWSDLLGATPSRGRSLWLAFVDDTARANPTLTQIEALPLCPDEVSIANLARMVQLLVAGEAPISGALLCLERGGSEGPSAFEEAWADALTTQLGGTLAWPVLVRTPNGVSCVRLGSSAA